MNKPEDTTIVVTIDGVDYALDIANLTGREVGVLKRIGHIKGISEIPEALDNGDLEVLAALAGIAMQRASITPNYDKLLDLPGGMIVLKLPDANPSQAAGQKSTEAPAAAGIPS